MQNLLGFQLQLFVISFDSEKMTLRVPVGKVKDSGLRKISSQDKMASAMTALRGRARAFALTVLVFFFAVCVPYFVWYGGRR